MMEQLKDNVKKAGLVGTLGQVQGADKAEESCIVCKSCWFDVDGCVGSCTNSVY